jgi:hypothetical protein
MKKSLVFLVILILFASACSLPGGGATQTAAPGKCGDGACAAPENAQNCPADCAASTRAPAAGPGGAAPLYITTMTHMEGPWNDDRDEGLFLNHVAQLRYGMDLAEEYNAILTIESEKPFARANTKWNLNILAEVLARGHGVGTHCDIGFKEPPMPVEQFAAMFAENKALVDALIGAQNNLGCSGGGSVNDWALAASMAGFEYLDGIVGMHYLAMPLENRPDSAWTDDFIREVGFHLNAPLDLYQRIYPFGVADARDFVADANPVIVVSSGEMGPLAGMVEGIGEVSGAKCRPECELNNADVDTLAAKIREIDQNRDRSRVAKLAIYIPANLFEPGNEPALRYFFEQMKALADQGVITWATQKQVYEAYVAWNP